jgi:hypothetical protein
VTQLQLELVARAGKPQARTWPANEADADERPQRRTPPWVATAVHVVAVAVAVVAASMLAVLVGMR